MKKLSLREDKEVYSINLYGDHFANRGILLPTYNLLVDARLQEGVWFFRRIRLTSLANDFAQDKAFTDLMTEQSNLSQTISTKHTYYIQMLNKD